MRRSESPLPIHDRTPESVSDETTNPTPAEQAELTARQLEHLLDKRSKYDVELVSKKSTLKRYRVSYGQHRVWLQERRGQASLQLEISRRDRRSLETDDWLRALEDAERIIREQVLAHHEEDVIEQKFSSAAGDCDLQVVVDFYRRARFVDDPNHKDHVGADHRKRLNRIWAIINLKFGMRRPVSWYGARFVERYIGLRTAEPIVFPEHWERDDCKQVAVRTAVNELKDLSGVITFAAKKRKVKANPLEGYEWDREWLQGDQHAVEHMEEAHTRRHQILMARSERLDEKTGKRLPPPINRIRAWDGGARARCIQAVLFHHGHRTVSTLAMMCEDVAFSRDEMRTLLAQAPNHRQWWADDWPHGAIFWRRSKVDYLRVTPMSRQMRIELERWRVEHPQWGPGIPVFPQMRDSRKPLVYDQINKWMHGAVNLARADLESLQVPVQQIDRWLAGEILHGWRDHWATKMDELGYGWDAATKKGDSKLDLHNHVAFMGDWATSGGAQAEVYAKLNPGILQAIAEFEKAEDVVRRFSAQAAEDLTGVLDAIYEDDTADDIIPLRRNHA
jgi:hypothetical protein